MVIFKGREIVFVVFRCSVFLLSANYQYGTEAVLMWTAPSPAWNQSNPGNTPADIQTAVFQVRNGSTNVLLRWNYTLLPAQTLLLTTFSIGDGISQDDIGIVITPGPTGTPGDKYKDIFRIYSTSQFSNLTINRVTEQENATFQCKLQVGSNAWAYNIRVEVTDPADITHISGNQTLNENEEVTLNCSAKGMPTPSITWTRVSDNSSVSFPLTITGKQDEEGYRCTAHNGIGNPASQVVYIIVESYSPIHTNLCTSLGKSSILVNTSFNITCSAQANPPAYYRFYKDQDYFVNDTTRSDISLITTSVSERIKEVNYSCTPFNEFGDGPRAGFTLTVLYAPGGTTLTTIGSNTTVPHGNILSLNCQTDASPEAKYHFYFNGTSIGNSSSGMFNTSVMADGMYTCVPVNTVGTGDNATVSISVVVAPSVEILNETATVVEGEDFVLTCNASGKPKPSVTWTKVRSAEVLSDTSSLTIVNVSRPGTPDNIIEYQCTASNGVGTPATDTVIVTVHYHPLVTVEPKQMKVGAGKNATFECKASGNPKPIIVWRRGAKEVQKENVLHFITATSDDEGCYLCSAANEEGTSNASVCLDVFDPEKEALEVNGRMKLTNESFKNELTNKSSESYQTLTSRVEIAIRGAFQSTYLFKEVYNATRVNKFENGSVVVFFTIIFNDVVRIDNAILVLVNASENGTLGDLKVDPGSIKAFQPVTTTPATSSPKVTATTNATSDDDKDHDIDPWIIIGVSTGGAIVLVIIIMVVAWCVHHKRKCRRKGSKVRCSESEEQAFTPREDNDHGHVNNGYAEAGPRPTAMVDMSQHQGASVAPTYAVVDKSAKKGKMKDKKDEEKKPQTEPPQYSVVDKSKKKKKKKEEEPEATYAQVDMSKKSKKAKPGEVLYADLGDFHQMQELPNVSTSPKALPPIKKPAPYVETQYADITQFLKGDVTLPDSDKSQGPATGTQPAPVPDNQESQEPGTSAKETSQASNPGGDGGPGHETNF